MVIFLIAVIIAMVAWYFGTSTGKKETVLVLDKRDANKAQQAARLLGQKGIRVTEIETRNRTKNNHVRVVQR